MPIGGDDQEMWNVNLVTIIPLSSRQKIELNLTEIRPRRLQSSSMDGVRHLI